MDSDESYETTSEVFREGDSEQSSSSSQASVNRDSSELRELYASTFSGPENATSIPTADNQIGSLTAKIKEQTIQIQSLKEERIKHLEQIAQLYTDLEKRESELVEFIQSYEQKANDVAQYMQEVQVLLSQLTTLFPDQLAEPNSPEESATQASPNASANSVAGSGSVNGDGKTATSADKTIGLENSTHQSHTNGPEPNSPSGWDQRGRALLHALSASVATASARNKQGTLPRNAEPPAGSHLPIAEIPPRPSTRLTGSKANGSTTSTVSTNANVATAKAKFSLGLEDPTGSTDNPEVTVCHLPPFCWSPEHVIYWLTEYACLPGGCVAAAKRVQLDGKQLTALSGNKADKLLCLSDAGLRRKFQLALEDLRVHGPPGVSRFPGPSHVRPQWICDVWLRQHIGLSQLAPLFAVRRIDGRLLASLAIYKRTGRGHTTALTNRNSRTQLISSPSELIVHPNAGSSLPGTPLPLNGARTQPTVGGIHNNNNNNNNNNTTNRISGSWRGASRKEFHRILLGLSRDNLAVNSSGGGISGADLPPEAKLILGKREACSLRAGIELLRQYNFNLEVLEKARREAETNNDNLLVWTNERVAKWLTDLGLKAFTEGIDGTGLHGAYMVLDPTFDLTRLMKHLHLPASVATAHRLDEQLQALLKPARQREGITPKQHSIFRRRSISRQGRTNLMQRSITSGSPMDYSSASTPHLLTHTGQTENHSTLDSNGNPFDSYPKTMPTNSSIITALSTLNSNFSRTLNGNQPADTPARNSISGTPKRGKFKSVTASGDLSNSRFTRVFSRGRPTGHSTGNNPVSQEQHTKVASSGKQLVDDASEEERSSTLVRRASAQPSATEPVLPPASNTGSAPTSSPMHATEPHKSTPSRGAVKPSEAPMVDPFTHSAGRARMRVVLGQSQRLSTLPTTTGCTSSHGGAVLAPVQSPVSPFPSLSSRDPISLASMSNQTAGPTADIKPHTAPISNASDISVKIPATASPEPSPSRTVSTLSLSSHSNNSLVKPLSETKQVFS